MATQDEPAQVETPITSGIIDVETHSTNDTHWIQPAPPFHGEVPQTGGCESTPGSASWFSSDFTTLPSSFTTTDTDLLTGTGTVEESSPNDNEPEKDLGSGYGVRGDKASPVLETHLVSCDDNRIVRQIGTVLSGSLQHDYLIKHYNSHVAELLLPLSHSDNPFRNIYLSTAMEGLLHYDLHMGTSKEMAYKALYQSLLASAAYHRWQCNTQDHIYRELGAKYRYHSIQSLQAAVAQVPATANYQTLMLAVLSLVTIGVLSGEADDFRIHIQAASELRALRSQWKLISHSSRRLNEIGAFLALLSDTTSFEPSPSPWSSNDQSNPESWTLRSSECYAFTYGITPTITMAINETCRLYRHLARFKLESKSLPDDFLQACEELGNLLQSWRFESEDITGISIGDGFTLSVFSCYAKAWHGAALIYYYTLIQGFERADLIREVDDVGEYMLNAEDLKSASKNSWQGNSMAPITWPAFIASCNAVRHRRGIWEQWWKRVLCYNLGNMSKQWDLVQKIWGSLDEAEDKGIWLSWAEAYDIHGINVLLV
ncbi:lysyl oxidase 2 3 4 [Fusarium beomiforme]|uniref:Lysyl oxidase 2 3 4 n=1 Tax=Fusarium beomiforme TaxID=44412 RepID=A0A9P5DZ63_9HYPO|nr:lysyl oxidase 2 3 4 [Fusarium beomiforme]